MSTTLSMPEATTVPGLVGRLALRRRPFLPLGLATLVALLLAALASPRVDYERAAEEAIDREESSSQLSPHERETALATARRVGSLGAYLGAAAGTGLWAFGAALCLWIGFKVVGGRPDLRGAFAAACLGLVPGAMERLLALPALLSRSRIAPVEVDRLLPASLGALLPAGTRSPLASLLWSLDLFSLLSVAVVSCAMAAVAGVSMRRSLLTTAALWLGYVAVFRVALPTFGGPP